MAASAARQHAEWLSLLDISGPFLSLPILLEVFPNGLDKKDNESEMRRRLRLAYEEWADNQGGSRPDPAIHTQWLRFILEEILDMQPDVILEGQRIPANLSYTSREHGEILRPTMVIHSPYENAPSLLIQLYPAKQNLEKPVHGGHSSPATQLMELLRNTNMRLGLVTNGEHWMLVHAPVNETTGFYSWTTDLWLEEPLTLQAFYSLLGMERFFNVPSDQRLEGMLEHSAMRQQEVTIQLGDQVRRAVEMLVQTLDRLDKDSGRELLHSLDEKELYEAALTVMMRLVFLLSAEERGLLMLGEELYDKNYAVSTLHKQLRELADQQAEEVLGLRYDAWGRLLAVFRVVYGGVVYQDMRLPAYGGHLFDPDRYPFLEGRQSSTSWRETPASPLLVDNRTVLHLLNALQYLQIRVPGGGIEPRRLSFRGLDVEQIGHVYEGLLDHTAKRAATTILGLLGSDDDEPEVPLEALESKFQQGELVFFEYMKDITGRSIAALQKSLSLTLTKREERARLMEACDNRQDIFDRVYPFAGFLRRDTFGNFVVMTPGSVYVTRGSDRRSTGTHYTPRSLTEPIVQHALDPLVYIGPAEGLPEEQWQLRSAAGILDLKVCDMAMGSGAFLVQACRYLSEKLVEVWDKVLNGNDNGQRPQVAPYGESSQGYPSEEQLPADSEERLAIARRLVAERCLYGVDKNPMAVEMAKLSLWLITLAKNRPFTFLDHALRSGDSLLGANERQLLNWSMDARPGEVTQPRWGLTDVMRRSLETALKLRRQLQQLPERDVRDIEAKDRLLLGADRAMEIVKLGADLLVAITLSDSKRRAALQDTLGVEYSVLVKAYEEAHYSSMTDLGRTPIQSAYMSLRSDVDELLSGRNPFHWSLEFPEVFAGKGNEAGFSAIMSNPPFMGGSKITGSVGTSYREYLVEQLANGKRGNADLCAYFFLRATQLVRSNGMCALLATNTIAQGDTREIGLDQIISAGWVIPRAISSRKWPGEAHLEVAYVWLKLGEWYSSHLLNDLLVEDITPFLMASNRAKGKPIQLNENVGKSFIGSFTLGTGFLLTPKEAQLLIAKNQRNIDVLFPFLNAEDLNTRFDQSPSRWTINFHDWPLEKAKTYPDCIDILEVKVKPERELNNDKKLRKPWWLFKRATPVLYSTIAHMKRVIAIPLHSKYMICTWEPTDIIFSHGLAIIASDSSAYFALIQCTMHSDWARANGSSLRNDLRYTPTDCFETFPSPSNIVDLDSIGEKYYIHRQSIMLARQEGLTKTYNRFHDLSEHSSDIVTLRQLHKEMDEAVVNSYGWDDLALEHGFHETKHGLRYTVSETARREILDRLTLLNHQRHEEEVRVGLFEKDARAKKKKGVKTPTMLPQSALKDYNGAANSDEVVEHGMERNTLF
jgi:Eco57I restriction-modification methylase/MmeI, target recognition domain/MmeI, N-terminal domain